jgi:hypothetical protein
MQKVVTVNVHDIQLASADRTKLNILETEYPLLNKYLEEGYVVLQTIPFQIPNTYVVSITFILSL